MCGLGAGDGSVGPLGGQFPVVGSWVKWVCLGIVSRARARVLRTGRYSPSE